MRIAIVFLLSGTLFISSISIAQEKVYVPFFSCLSCEKTSGYSAAFIFADHVNKNALFHAVLAEKRDTLYEAEDLNLARESAELISTKYFVIGEILKLEGRYFVKISMYATSSGLLFWSASRQSNHRSDLSIILAELASEMAIEKGGTRSGDIYLVTKSEGRKVQRIKSNVGIGLITGAMLPLSESEVDNLNPGLGGQISFDARTFIFEGSSEIYFGQDSTKDGQGSGTIQNKTIFLGINTIYPITSANSTPFACGGASFTYTESENYNVSLQSGQISTEYSYQNGLMFSGGGGYALKRNSNSPLFIYARGYIILNGFEDPAYGAMLNFALKFEL